MLGAGGALHTHFPVKKQEKTQENCSSQSFTKVKNGGGVSSRDQFEVRTTVQEETNSFSDYVVAKQTSHTSSQTTSIICHTVNTNGYITTIPGVSG